MNCGICSKHLVSGDYVYGACHSCARKVINKAKVINKESKTFLRNSRNCK